MAKVELNDRIWFQVPTPQGLIDVMVPFDLSEDEANQAGSRIRAILWAMFGGLVQVGVGVDVDVTVPDGMKEPQ